MSTNLHSSALTRQPSLDGVPTPATGLLLRSRDASRALAISERTLWALTQRGEIPCIRIGRSVRYSRADLEAYIAARRQGGTHE